MVINGIETFHQNKIAYGFNKYFTEIGPKLASSVLTSSKDFKQFMDVSETVFTFQQEFTFQDEESEKASNKSPGHQTNYLLTQEKLNIYFFINKTQVIVFY